MGLYLYCLGGPDHPPPDDVAGIDGARVHARPVAGFAAWVSELDSASKPSLERVREHNRVVERACAEVTALPLRFGQFFHDAAALEGALSERREGLERSLGRVRDAVEMGVRILDPAHHDDPRPDRSTGRAYLEGLARRDARATTARERGAALAAELREWLGALVRDARVRPLGTAAGLVTIAYLVDRHDTGGYDARLRAFPERHKDLHFMFSGPWPPYGFADEERPADG